MPVEPTAFSSGERPAIRGEKAGEGAPVVLCHGITATRRSIVHGSRRLERDGYAVVAYDARGHGESDPAPEGEGYDYPRLVGDLESTIAAEVGDGPVVLAGHSMGAHTAVSYALRHPERVAGLVAIGPTYTGKIAAESLRYWDGLAAALESDGVDGFVDYIDGRQGIDPAWRDSVLRFTRERMLRHRHLDALVIALRGVPRSKPFEAFDELESLEVPTLVVASRDEADPGHPYAIAQEYAERLPQARLVSEAEGQSPLAWQGGRLSREIAAFCAEPEVAARF
ncbi:MAG TPA: alpha/beta hydrolase [Solirubrobacterales bacterium]|jgi:pimeloyl-ACP methyl ester carboxylesterase|nr:alpha/beta hydrolase [Solirubrobacterales bacterium]